MKQKLLLLGWDGADPAIVRELLAVGRLPHLARLLTHGGQADLLTTRPILSPTAWTTVVTGKRPDVHRVLGDLELDDEQSAIRPASAYGRHAAALWEIVEAAGGTAHTIHFPSTQPTISSPRGIHIGPDVFEWDVFVDPAAHFPAELRLAATDIGHDALAELLPALRDPSLQDALRRDNRLALLRGTLARIVSVHAVATWALESQPEWNLTALMYPGIEHVSQAFMRFRSPRLPEVSEADHAAFAGVVDSVYVFHDTMLGRLVDLAGPEANVMLVSDHGYATGADRMTRDDLDSETWARGQHRRAGIAVWSGAAFVPGSEIDHARTIDVTPTALLALGLTPASDMPGRVWEEVIAPTALAHSEAAIAGLVPGTARIGSLEPNVKRAKAPASPSRRAAEHLVTLGYRDVPPPPANAAALAVQSRRQFALAEALVDAGRYDAAVRAVRLLVARDPKRVEYSALMFEALYRGGRMPEAWQLVSALRARGMRGPLLELGTAIVELYRRKPADALARLRAAEVDMPASADLREIQGEAYLALNDYANAREAFARAAELDPASDRARIGLSIAALNLGDAEAALQHALEAVDRQFDSPAAHEQLGHVLARMKRARQAETAFRRALAIYADRDSAATALARLYREQLESPDAASEVEQTQRQRALRRRHIAAQAASSGKQDEGR